MHALKSPAWFAEESASPTVVRALVLLLFLAPLCSGCVAVAAAGVIGVGIVQYQRNEAEQDFPTDLEATWRAAGEGLRRLEITPTESGLGPSEGRLSTEEMQVIVERHPEGFTRVRVRFNTFHSADNERRARIVLQEIEASIQSQDELRVWGEKVNGQRTPGTPPVNRKP